MVTGCVDGTCEERSLTRVAPATSVRDALALMAERGVGAVPVMEGYHLVGIFTERDMINRVIALARDIDATTVGEAMSPDAHAIARGYPRAPAPRTGLDDAFPPIPTFDFPGIHFPGIVGPVPAGVLLSRAISRENRSPPENRLTARTETDEHRPPGG